MPALTDDRFNDDPVVFYQGAVYPVYEFCLHKVGQPGEEGIHVIRWFQVFDLGGGKWDVVVRTDKAKGFTQKPNLGNYGEQVGVGSFGQVSANPVDINTSISLNNRDEYEVWGGGNVNWASGNHYKYGHPITSTSLPYVLWSNATGRGGGADYVTPCCVKLADTGKHYIEINTAGLVSVVRISDRTRVNINTSGFPDYAKVEPLLFNQVRGAWLAHPREDKFISVLMLGAHFLPDAFNPGFKDLRTTDENEDDLQIRYAFETQIWEVRVNINDSTGEGSFIASASAVSRSGREGVETEGLRINEWTDLSKGDMYIAADYSWTGSLRWAKIRVSNSDYWQWTLDDGSACPPSHPYCQATMLDFSSGLVNEIVPGTFCELAEDENNPVSYSAVGGTRGRWISESGPKWVYQRIEIIDHKIIGNSIEDVQLRYAHTTTDFTHVQGHYGTVSVNYRAYKELDTSLQGVAISSAIASSVLNNDSAIPTVCLGGGYGYAGGSWIPSSPYADLDAYTKKVTYEPEIHGTVRLMDLRNGVIGWVEETTTRTTETGHARLVAGFSTPSGVIGRYDFHDRTDVTRVHVQFPEGTRTKHAGESFTKRSDPFIDENWGYTVPTSPIASGTQNTTFKYNNLNDFFLNSQLWQQVVYGGRHPRIVESGGFLGPYTPVTETEYQPHAMARNNGWAFSSHPNGAWAIYSAPAGLDVIDHPNFRTSHEAVVRKAMGKAREMLRRYGDTSHLSDYEAAEASQAVTQQIYDKLTAGDRFQFNRSVWVDRRKRVGSTDPFDGFGFPQSG